MVTAMSQHVRRLAWLVPLLLAVGCGTPWVKHERRMAEAESAGDWNGAMQEVQWLIDNAMFLGPKESRSREAEADRYLLYADFAIRAGHNKAAVRALREALMLDPTCAPSVRMKVARMPLSPAERERVDTEFAWNLTALAPGEIETEADRSGGRCWSYRASEIRIRGDQIQRTERGKERQLRYDMRPWRYEARTDQWTPEGDWLIDAGAETQVFGAPSQLRYEVIRAANGGFLTDSAVPPCHRNQWQGPFLPNNTLFVAPRLPAISASPH